uniref:Exonuclease domain-containing protein n=1 Tax=Syphacia muris TaxID=451379 RepID=A0A0N5AX22_9BILA
LQVNPKLNENEWQEYQSRRAQNNAIRYAKEDLTDKNCFDVEWKGIELFLQNLPKPLCILAHNGIKYDFQVLYAELRRINQLNSSLFSSEMYFVDTYAMFMSMEKKFHNDLRMLVEFIDWKRLLSKAETPIYEQQSISSPNKQNTSVNEDNDHEKRDIYIIKSGIRSYQYEHDKFPISTIKLRYSCEKREKRKLFPNVDIHPLKFIRMESWSPAKKIRIRSNFFRRNADGDWQFDNLLAMQYFHEKNVFRLEEMYRQLTSRDFDAHHAQDDCEALMQICIAYGQDFLNYVDRHASRFPVLNCT